MALQLLSDKEKNDLAQLVSKMVSYAITYKTVKSDMLPQTLKCEVADGLTLSLVPPISDFINFKVWTLDHWSSVFEEYQSQPDFNIFSVVYICAGLYFKSLCAFCCYEAGFDT